MAEFQIRLHEEGDFHPEYAGIDWLEVRLRRLGQTGLEAAELWFCVEDELGTHQQQVTQENAQVSLNFTEPGLDCASIRDDRDSNSWVWFRTEMGEEAFEGLIGTLGDFCLRISTMYPRPNIAEQYDSRQQRALDADMEEFLHGN